VITLVRLEQTCSTCPSQWDAWDADGTYYYIRYRWGCLTVERGEVWGELIYDGCTGDPLDGSMPTAPVWCTNRRNLDTLN